MDCAGTSMVSNPSGFSCSARPSGNSSFIPPAVPGACMPTDINLTPVLKFFTESMNHLVSTIKLNQQSVQRTIQEQQQQFTSHLELLCAKIAQTASAAPPGQSSPSDPNDDGEDGVDNILPPPKKRRRCRDCSVSRCVVLLIVVLILDSPTLAYVGLY